jgi:hypothetical protein
MAENDGNTAPEVQASAVHRPLQITPSELMPVTPGVFEIIHKLNIRFERLLHDFQTLQRVPYFPHEKLSAWQNTLGLIQAETNLSLIEPIKDRERKNALYFDRLCAQWERQIEDPDDVLLEAEYRKQELADQQKQKTSKAEESAI